VIFLSVRGMRKNASTVLSIASTMGCEYLVIYVIISKAMTHLLLPSVRRFAHRHDELPAFHAAYFVITVLTAALFSLGLFTALIAAHMALDVVKYREVHALSMRKTLEGVFRESLLDVMLLLVGFTFAVYLHHTMGIAGVSGLLRSELTILRGIGTLLPKFAITSDLLKICVHFHQYLHHPDPRIGKGWSSLEQLQILTIVLALALLFVAAPMMGVGQGHVLGIIGGELLFWVR
jgi:hypothetical protein